MRCVTPIAVPRIRVNLHHFPKPGKEPRRMSQIALATREQFVTLRETVRQLAKVLTPAHGPQENTALMQQLRKTASLTDGMAALQLSVRLEATEKVLDELTSMVTQLVNQTPGVTLDVSKDLQL